MLVELTDMYFVTGIYPGDDNLGFYGEGGETVQTSWCQLWQGITLTTSQTQFKQ